MIYGFGYLLFYSYEGSRNVVSNQNPYRVNNRATMYLNNYDLKESFIVLLVIFVALLVVKIIVDFCMKKSASKDGFSNLYEGMFRLANRDIGERSNLIEAIMFILSIVLFFYIENWNISSRPISCLVLVLSSIFVKMYFDMPIYKGYSLKTKLLCILSYLLFLSLLFMIVILFGLYFSLINIIILVFIILAIGGIGSGIVVRIV